MHVSTCQVPRSLWIKNSHHDNDRLLKLVERQLALDFNEPQHDTDMRLSSREQEMLKRQQSSVKRVAGGKYEIGLLWKIDPSALADNRAMALGSLKSLGKKLLRDRDRLDKYKTFIDEMVTQEQAECVPLTSEALRKVACGSALILKDGVWYLIHHDVGPKFRVVFNGAASYAGKSLNSCLDKGPEHTSTLLGALLRWRTYAYAASGDIKGMFYHVSLPENDRDQVRFLWWENGDPTQPIVEYRLSHQVPGLGWAKMHQKF